MTFCLVITLLYIGWSQGQLDKQKTVLAFTFKRGYTWDFPRIRGRTHGLKLSTCQLPLDSIATRGSKTSAVSILYIHHTSLSLKPWHLPEPTFNLLLLVFKLKNHLHACLLKLKREKERYLKEKKNRTFKMEREDGYESWRFVEEEGCATPRHGGCRIPATLVCPPPPKKKRRCPSTEVVLKKPKNGYFHPPDLDLFFAMAPRRQACV